MGALCQIIFSFLTIFLTRKCPKGILGRFWGVVRRGVVVGLGGGLVTTTLNNALPRCNQDKNEAHKKSTDMAKIPKAIIFGAHQFRTKCRTKTNLLFRLDFPPITRQSQEKQKWNAGKAKGWPRAEPGTYGLPDIGTPGLLPAYLCVTGTGVGQLNTHKTVAIQCNPPATDQEKLHSHRGGEGKA